ncbi:ornithine racemase Orr [Helicovermis profundi]|uniref:Ornithine racemase Orr n=1 Tax=Helicovermis profundi TaxID=3065157 RepID=A0AAU9EEI5_9FIRM|nr:ornithine racemase Orr [Clostridia bacterium S502]
MYPKLKINLCKLEENTKFIKEKCDKNGISIMVVTKSFCALNSAAKAVVDGGADMLADSRISNLVKIKDLKVPKVLLRLPMLSETKEVVKFADISLNSEIDTIKSLSVEANKLNKIHNVLLMIDLGDLREGILPCDVDKTVEEILKLSGVNLYGIGVNLTCYGGVIPDEINLGKLTEIATNIENKFKIKLEMISGGNSSSIYLLDNGKMPSKINNLRPGEVIVLGRETAFGELIEGMHTDIFTLEAEVIELKEKDSIPTGNIGMDAFGNNPVFLDKGKMKRAIIAIGRQDVNPDGLTPYDKDIEIVGASSDHLILDLTNTGKDYSIGSVIKFNIDYGALLMLTTSEYIEKEYIK